MIGIVLVVVVRVEELDEISLSQWYGRLWQFRFWIFASEFLEDLFDTAGIAVRWYLIRIQYNSGLAPRHWANARAHLAPAKDDGPARSGTECYHRWWGT